MDKRVAANTLTRTIGAITAPPCVVCDNQLSADRVGPDPSSNDVRSPTNGGIS